jgi:hypothetical protein
VPWYTPLWWIEQVRVSPAVKWGTLGLATALTLAVGWLIRVVARPKDRPAAFGFAAATGLIAMLTATLFIGPFAATSNDEARDTQLHHLARENEVAEAAARHECPSPVKQDLEALARNPEALQFPPEDETKRVDRLLALRARAVRTNRVYAASLGIGLGVMFGVTWFLGFSFFATWAADLMARSRRGWYGRWEVYAGGYGAGMILTVASAFYMLTAILNANTNKGPMREYLLPGYLAAAGLCVVYLWGVNRSVARDWKWWAFELFSVGWLIASVGVLAAVGYFLM